MRKGSLYISSYPRSAVLGSPELNACSNRLKLLPKLFKNSTELFSTWDHEMNTNFLVSGLQFIHESRIIVDLLPCQRVSFSMQLRRNSWPKCHVIDSECGDNLWLAFMRTMLVHTVFLLTFKLNKNAHIITHLSEVIMCNCIITRYRCLPYWLLN